MANEKSLDDLIKQVADTGMGLSPQDLDALLNETVATPTSTQQPAAAGGTTAIPSPATTTEPTPPKVEPNIQEFLPEELRDADARSSAKKVTKTIADLKDALRKREEELAALQSLAQVPPPQAWNQPSVPAPVPGKPDDEDEADDSAYWEKPRETVTKQATKIAAQVAATMLEKYHQLQYRQRQIEEFSRNIPDFELYREEMATLARQRPDLENHPNALHILYSAAKQRAGLKADMLRKQLGLEATPKPQGNPPEEPKAPAQTEDQLAEKIKAKILAEIEKRRAAAGLAGGTNPTRPGDRVEDKGKTTPKTYDEEVLEAMLGAGPKRLELVPNPTK
jgi:hypothetical protein